MWRLTQPGFRGEMNTRRRALDVVVQASFGAGLALLLAAPAFGLLLGADVTTTSQLNADPVESRTDIVIDPGAEIQFGDGNAFSWMTAGDSIDLGPHTNPNAPWRLDVIFGPSHTFEALDVLTLTFELDPPLQFAEPAAITLASNVLVPNPVTLGSVMTIEMTALDQVNGFGGHLGIVFNVVPEPSALLLLATSLAALAWRGRRG